MKILSFFDPDPEKLNYKPDWKVMSVRQKAAYIRDYYKIPIAVGLALLILVISLIVHYVKRTNTVLYVGSANLLLSEEDRSVLTDGYIAAASLGKRDRVSFSELGFISEDEKSAYIGETEIIFMKLMAVCAADQLDVVLLDRHAFDVFSRSGYLLDLSALPKGTIPEELRELLVENAVEVDSITTGEFNEESGEGSGKGSSEESGEESSEESGGKASGETGEESGGKASGETGEESGVGSGEPGDGSEPETEMRTLGIDLSAGAGGDQPDDAGESQSDDTDENQSDDTDENRSDDAGENRSDGTLPQDSPHIYACILEQTSRLEESLDYIRYLCGIGPFG